GSDSLAPVSAARAAQSGIASAEGKVDLVVELARLAGMPARMVSGVDVARPELPAHVWAEVWTGDRWTAVDPVYGSVPVSPTLLRVTTGSAGRPLALVPLIGSLRTTVLSKTR
ncbi:MAG TPA: transglutaminase domain-containing protein, partial [Gemmatimonadales bacterium]|nr:transglutaminase domain-containing protein [Gemmatimonadales bacterium]